MPDYDFHQLSPYDLEILARDLLQAHQGLAVRCFCRGIVGRFTEGRQMQDWHSTCLGRRTLPRDLSAFEIEAFFNFSDAERRVIEDRRGPALKLALALQIGFLRMTGRLLEAVRIVPPALWRHLGEQLGVAAPDLASLRSMYQRRRTLFEHQEGACETLGFH